MEFYRPEATYFLFLSVEKYLNGKSYNQLIAELFGNDVSVAPGEDFGRGFENYIRLCFTGETPERLEIAIERLNKIFN